MAFKMRSNPMQRNFGSALKHYTDKDNKVLPVHSHKSKDGDVRHHGQDRNTGRKSTYDESVNDRGENVLTRNRMSSFGTNKFDE